MQLEDMDFSPEFFEDEVREGFFVSSVMKRFWAAQLKVLAEVDRICRKHQICWFMDSGTLLGAVRHAGFIPWDDDLDICMLRPDYARFIEAAQTELPEAYQLLAWEMDDTRDQGFGRVVNMDELNWGEVHLSQFYGCPYTVGVDIFPLDGVPNDDVDDRKQLGMLVNLRLALQEIRDGKTDSEMYREALVAIERDNGCVIERGDRERQQLICLHEELMRKVSVEQSDWLALMVFRVTNFDRVFPKDYYEEVTMLPFEGLLLPAPVQYDGVLRAVFGDNYWKADKSGGAHEYPVYKKQEKTFYDVNGYNFLRYTLKKEALEKPNERKTFRQSCFEITGVLKKAHGLMDETAEKGDFNAIDELFKSCQNIAVTLGERLENRFVSCGETVHLLEEYCEQIYCLFEEWNDEGVAVLDQIIEKFEGELSRLVDTAPKEILFLPCRAKWWDQMAKAYREAKDNSGNVVYVMPQPYSQKGANGENYGSTDDGAFFPDNLSLVPSEDYVISERCPDVIVIQDPFDGWSSWLDIPEGFYSRNLRKYTGMLVYIPCFDPDDPEEDGDRVSEALRYLIEQPAVVYADRVVLKSEKMRALYIKVLTELSGEEWKEYWEKKIIIGNDGWLKV